MSQVEDIFNGLLDGIKVTNDDVITGRRDEITKALNKNFRDIDGSVQHRLMVGSYGRWTAIRGISDLDMLFILPNRLKDEYEKTDGPSKVLARVRKVIQDRYTSTTVTVDRLVVVVEFANFMFEVQPVFENEDKSFSYPDTKTDSWKTTKPRSEIDTLRSENEAMKGSLRRLCKLTRAWKNKHGVVMGGLLIDTLAYNFLRDREEHHSSSLSACDALVRDFFEFLSDESEHDFYAAIGSGQRVAVKKPFQRKAKKAFDLCVEAIDAAGQKNEYKKWRAVFGNAVPVIGTVAASATLSSEVRTEEFIEDQYLVDIRHSLTIDCTVTQNGFRPQSLRNIVRTGSWLLPEKELAFFIDKTDAPRYDEVRWKVLNRGDEAERRKMVRGQIIKPNMGRDRTEKTNFRGDHHVECYLIRGGVVVARDRLEVPIRLH